MRSYSLDFTLIEYNHAQYAGLKHVALVYKDGEVVEVHKVVWWTSAPRYIIIFINLIKPRRMEYGAWF